MKNLLTLLLISFVISLHAESLKDIKFDSIEVSEVTSIYDGDTFRVNIEGYPRIIGYRVPIRVNGIDTPEMRAKCQQEKELARKAKQLTASMLHGAKKIVLKNVQRGKYFRIVADVYIDGDSLGEELIKRGFAVSYDGGTKSKDWCK